MGLIHASTTHGMIFVLQMTQVYIFTLLVLWNFMVHMGFIEWYWTEMKDCTNGQ